MDNNLPSKLEGVINPKKDNTLELATDGKKMSYKKMSANNSVSVLASADVSAIKTASLAGKEYTVVPIIALLEGVWQGALADGGELALASEFGKYPASWNARPITLGHPQRAGNFVSAGSPDVYQSEVIGSMYNTTVKDNKLKTEAWICNEKVDQIGDAAINMVDRLKSGEMVEVSTGFFMDLEEASGTYNGVDFVGIWRNIVPDHLALLAEGTLGACSVADGAGAPRTNQLRVFSRLSTKEDNKPKIIVSNEKENNMAANATNAINSAESKEISRLGIMFKHILDGVHKVKEGIKVFQDMTYSSIMGALGAALSMLSINAYVIDVVGESVIYYDFNEYQYLMRKFSIDSAGKVTLGADITPVRSEINYVPINATVEGNQMSANQVNQTATTTATTEQSKATSAVEVTADENKVETQTEITSANAQSTTAKEAIQEINKIPATLEEFIATAPESMRAVLSSGIKMHNEAKLELVKALRSNSKCLFSEQELNAMDIQQLTKLAQLAETPTYIGRNCASVQSHKPEAESNYIPMVKAFEAKTVGGNA